VRRGEKVVRGGGGNGDTRATVIGGGKYWGQKYKKDSRPATARVGPQLI